MQTEERSDPEGVAPQHHPTVGGVQDAEGEDAVQLLGHLFRSQHGVQMDDGLAIALRADRQVELLVQLRHG